MHEAAITLGDAHAVRLFERGVDKALALQGPDGEWPWMLDNRTGTTVDPYPVFRSPPGQHGDALPPPGGGPRPRRIERSDRQKPGVDLRCERTREADVLERPFFAYRSIERDESFPGCGGTRDR
jgi:hypothetical protein